MARVEFRAGTNTLGIVTNAPYGLTLASASAGIYEWRAVAFDAVGLSTTSAVVQVSVSPPVLGQPVFRLGQASYRVGEASGFVVVTIEKSANSAAASVNYTTVDGSARALANGSGDYEAVSGALSFGALETTRSVQIPIVDDAAYEGDQSFTLALGSPNAGGVLGNPASTTIVIVDNDPPATSQSVLDVVYPDAAPGDRGALRVVLDPAEIGGRWRFVWETAWRGSGTVALGLVPGRYEVEYWPVAGYVTPTTRVIAVAGTQLTAVGATYMAAATVGGTGPSVLPDFASLSTELLDGYPYAFNGQILTDVGFGSGCVVKRRVVLTAAHLVFNDASFSSVNEAWWSFQRFLGEFEPIPQRPRGWYVFSSYADARRADNTPGVSSPASQDLDAAALYSLEDAGRGGSGGYRAGLPRRARAQGPRDSSPTGRCDLRGGRLPGRNPCGARRRAEGWCRCRWSRIWVCADICPAPREFPSLAWALFGLFRTWFPWLLLEAQILGAFVLATTVHSIRNYVARQTSELRVRTFQLKGIARPVEVIEVLRRLSEGESRPDWVATFDEALTLFHGRQFDAASRSFDRVVELRSQAENSAEVSPEFQARDGPSLFYLQQIAKFRSAPPSVDWVGEIVMEEK